jgi:hydrogenase nickel incorporation protein HypB
MKVAVIENVLKLNDELAALNRAALRDAGVFTVDIIGAPGCGKTALLEATIQKLQPDIRCAAIVGDLATQRDADRMARFCDHVVQVNTGKGCHLEAHHIRQALAKLELSSIDLLFIENVGNLICPVGFDLGQDVKIGVFSICGGDDKAAKHPYLVHEASLLLLTKMDLLPHVPFDLDLFERDVADQSPNAQMLRISVRGGDGVSAWTQWLLQRMTNERPWQFLSDGRR